MCGIALWKDKFNISFAVGISLHEKEGEQKMPITRQKCFKYS